MIASASRLILIVLAVTSFSMQLVSAQSPDCLSIERRLPPQGWEIPADKQAVWQSKISELRQQLDSEASPLAEDILVLIKACDYAIRHREVYHERDFSKIDRLLDLAAERIGELESESPSWLQHSGLQVRGYRSTVDGSAQPFGLVFPEEDTGDQQVPLYVWLHGRGDQVTDLHFICERLDKVGQIRPEGAIVLHPFGRQCVGYKSAGETDVMEAIDFVCKHYPVDPRRIVLMGFSMGGAGVWHLAAHYGECFVAASPGAGFAETARYQGLRPEQFPADYEQILWRVYDVPGYTRNLFNLPVVAYSGENDKQIQAARVMEEAFRKEGRQLPHLIGPGMGHKYHPDTLNELLGRMSQAAERGKPLTPGSIHIQSPHLRYASREWLAVDGAREQYGDTRVDASRSEAGRWSIQTQNVRRLVIDSGLPGSPQQSVDIDEQAVRLLPQTKNRLWRDRDGSWRSADHFPWMRKHPGLSGPIDDAFIDAFLVVEPSGSSSHAEIDRWVECELEFLKDRWRSLFRGQLPVKLDQDVTEADIERCHLILWGTPESNQLIARVLEEEGQGESKKQGLLSSIWSKSGVGITGKYAADRHIPVLVYPNPLQPQRYLVFNSGPTFRPAHDRTNSLQNPHLPDWAILSLAEPRSDERAGLISEAGFFGDDWQLDPEMTWVHVAGDR